MATAPRHVKLTDAERSEVVELLTDRHAVHLMPGEGFTFSGYVSHGEVYLKLELANADDTDVFIAEGRIDLVDNDIQDPHAGRYALMDFLDEVVLEYFEKDRGLRPDMDWKQYEYQGNEVCFRGQRLNRKLEAMADALLERN